MSAPRCVPRLLPVVLALIAGCGPRARHEPLLAAETFHWIRQPITFSSPPARWYREGDNGAGKLGVRFVLRNGGGQCISIAGHRWLDERVHVEELTRLAGRIDSLNEHEFLREASLVEARSDDPVSDRDGAIARDINDALERARTDYLEGNHAFAAADVQQAAKIARSYQPTLAELLPRLRLRPEKMQNPEYWRLGRARDTVLAGLPAYASDDTLVLPEQTLLYHQVYWVVNGSAFEAIFQGREENLETFHRVVDSITFPSDAVH